jgi:hypothetical protein
MSDIGMHAGASRRPSAYSEVTILDDSRRGHRAGWPNVISWADRPWLVDIAYLAARDGVMERSHFLESLQDDRRQFRFHTRQTRRCCLAIIANPAID